VVRNGHTTDRDEAERQLAAALGEKAKGLPVVAHQLTLDEAVKNVKAAKAADNKPVNYAYDKHLMPFFGARTKMASITTPRIRQYIVGRRSAGAANATVNRELEALSFAFTLAIKDGVMAFKPHIPMLDEDNVRTGFFERGIRGRSRCTSRATAARRDVRLYHRVEARRSVEPPVAQCRSEGGRGSAGPWAKHEEP
jgi:hypothetical protein